MYSEFYLLLHFNYGQDVTISGHILSYPLSPSRLMTITLHLYMGDALIKSILTGCFVIFLSYQANARIPQLGHYLFFSNPFPFTNHHVIETIQSETLSVS